jgi:hypothetical protein
MSDRYRIERELGQVGMATLYLAEDPKHERMVAPIPQGPRRSGGCPGLRLGTWIQPRAGPS